MRVVRQPHAPRRSHCVAWQARDRSSDGDAKQRKASSALAHFDEDRSHAHDEKKPAKDKPADKHSPQQSGAEPAEEKAAEEQAPASGGKAEKGDGEKPAGGRAAGGKVKDEGSRAEPKVES